MAVNPFAAQAAAAAKSTHPQSRKAAGSVRAVDKYGQPICPIAHDAKTADHMKIAAKKGVFTVTM